MYLREEEEEEEEVFETICVKLMVYHKQKYVLCSQKLFGST